MTETSGQPKPSLSQRLIEGADALSSRGHSPNGGENSGRVCAICDAMALLREASTTIERLEDALRMIWGATEPVRIIEDDGSETLSPVAIGRATIKAMGLDIPRLTQEGVQPPSESQR